MTRRETLLLVALLVMIECALGCGRRTEGEPDPPINGQAPKITIRVIGRSSRGGMTDVSVVAMLRGEPLVESDWYCTTREWVVGDFALPIEGVPKTDACGYTTITRTFDKQFSVPSAAGQTPIKVTVRNRRGYVIDVGHTIVLT